jgi:hypothetical protein
LVSSEPSLTSFDATELLRMSAPVSEPSRTLRPVTVIAA